MDYAVHRPKMRLEDWLDDLCVRFIINLPPEDLSSVSRICFQVEEAQWFYEDFIRPLDPTLPSMSLRTFCLRMFQHCPLLSSFSEENHMRAFEEFMQYKTRIPVRGAILLNDAMDSAVLVKGWKKAASWSFPRGKINKDEDDLDCAIREVYEETGYDINAAGLVPETNDVFYIEIPIRGSMVRLYVFRDIPMDTVFEPKTRKEISKVAWYRLSQLPAYRKKGGQANDESSQQSHSKFYMVAPFLVLLKKWVVQQKKKDALRHPAQTYLTPHPTIEETFTEDDLATQTEAPVEPQRITPAIDTFEGATRELQRLLKVQPPSSGMQIPVPASTAHSQDRGGALLAMLQNSAGSKQPAPGAIPPSMAQQQQNLPPHTPLDHTYMNPPEPHTPHHHHPAQRMPLSSYAPPPNFPVPPHHAGVQGGLPNQHHQQSMHAPYPGYPGPHDLHGPHGHHGMHPSQPAYREPMPVRHPQPAPPPSQNAQFNPGNVPSGMVGNPGANSSYPGMSNQVPHMPVMGQQQPLGNPTPQAHLTDQKMSLLNAFKGLNVKDAHDNVPQGTQNMRNPPQAQSQTPTWPNSEEPNSPTGPGSNIMHGQKPQLSDGRQQLPFNGLPNPAPTSEKHRNQLLDMFKQQTLVSSQAPPATLSASSMAQQGLQSTTRHTIGANSAAASGTMPPFKSLDGVSTFSKEKAGNHSHAVQPQSSAGARPAGVPYEQPGHPSFQAPAPASLPVPAILQRQRDANPEQQQKLLSLFGKPQATSSAPTNAVQANPTQAQNLLSLLGKPPSQSAAPAPSTSGANAGQKEKLLSLFGQPQATSPPAVPVTDDKGKGKAKEVNLLEMLKAGGQTAQKPALAAVGPPGTAKPMAAPAGGLAGADQSNSSAQTPISPADRSFLLGYLQSASGAR